MLTLETRPISPAVGTEIVGIDLRNPIEPAQEPYLRDALTRYRLLLFRNQEISQEDQLRVSRIFGAISRQGGQAARGYGDVGFISNVHPEGKAGDGELLFHADQM